LEIARYDRKAALKVLAKVKQKRVLAEQSLRRNPLGVPRSAVG
jgi:hypothetical protein